MDDDVAGAAPVVVTLPAEIDIANADQVFGRLCLAIGSGAGIVIADLTGTDFCGSAGIGAVLMARDRAAAEGVRLRLALQPSGPVRSLFQLMGLDRKLQAYVTRPENILRVSWEPASSCCSTTEPPSTTRWTTTTTRPGG
jgi:anti-sigma B factor antagonist